MHSLLRSVGLVALGFSLFAVVGCAADADDAADDDVRASASVTSVEPAGNDLGPDNRQKKNITTIKPTPAKVSVGIGMGREGAP